MFRRFEDDSHINTRALQIYQVLVSLAWNRQTITYALFRGTKWTDMAAAAS
jgi:hypothetical protein